MTRRLRSQDAAVSLFPFLAVLICTMGALIVLLVVVVQKAGQVAISPTALPPVETTDPNQDKHRQELEVQQQDLDWQARVLTESRNETMHRLRQEQTELSMIEDHARRLQQKLDRLFEESQKLDDLLREQSISHDDSHRLQAELSKQIAEATHRLEQAKREQSQRRPQFAVVPYEGPHGTKRRPIYVECRADAIVIQPEQIKLSADDFLGPLGHDNPLAVAVRAIREHWVNVGLVPTSNEPYPLILVRPDGAGAFAACRAALRDWDDDFGYELIPDDMELSFPDPDHHLKLLVERTLDDMRWRRRQQLADPSQQLVLTTTSRQGGFVRDGAPPRSRRTGSGNGASSPGGQALLERRGQISRGATDASFTATHIPHGSPTGEPSSFGNSAQGDFQPVSSSSPSGRQADSTLPNQMNSAQDNASGAQAAGEPNSPVLTSNAAHVQTILRPGSNSIDSSSGNKLPPADGLNSEAHPDVAAATQNLSRNMNSIARTQGANWALPGASHGAIGIQRPVSLRCDVDRFEVLPESGTLQASVIIPVSSDIEASVRDVVTALWNRVDSWGMAGTGTYWKPVLEVTVSPAGETRFAELSQLLDNSGIHLIRR